MFRRKPGKDPRVRKSLVGLAPLTQTSKLFFFRTPIPDQLIDWYDPSPEGFSDTLKLLLLIPSR